MGYIFEIGKRSEPNKFFCTPQFFKYVGYIETLWGTTVRPMVNIFKKFTDSQRLEACQICRGVARGPSPPPKPVQGGADGRRGGRGPTEPQGVLLMEFRLGALEQF